MPDEDTELPKAWTGTMALSDPFPLGLQFFFPSRAYEMPVFSDFLF